jgi:hypothetical protein
VVTAIIVAVDLIGQRKAYRVMKLEAEMNKEMFIRNTNFEFSTMSEEDIIGTMRKGLVWYNADVKDGKLHGKTGSLDRFMPSANGYKPLVIISEKVDTAGNVLSYRIINSSGIVNTVSKADLIGHGKKVAEAGAIPVQNAIFVEEANGNKAFYRCFADSTFFKEMYQENKKRMEVVLNSQELRGVKTTETTHVYSQSVAKSSDIAEDVLQGRVSGDDIRSLNKGEVKEILNTTLKKISDEIEATYVEAKGFTTETTNRAANVSKWLISASKYKEELVLKYLSQLKKSTSKFDKMFIENSKFDDLCPEFLAMCVEQIENNKDTESKKLIYDSPELVNKDINQMV